jgi:hypothetical protein
MTTPDPSPSDDTEPAAIPPQAAEPTSRRGPARAPSWRRLFLLDDPIRLADQQGLRPGSPGWTELERALAAQEAGAALMRLRQPLARSDGTAAASSLFREALWWTCLARIRCSAPHAALPSSPAEAWRACLGLPACTLGALDPAIRDFAETSFLRRSFVDTVELDPNARRDELRALRTAVERETAALEHDSRHGSRLRVERVVRIVLAVALLAAIIVGPVIGLRRWLRGPNLALGATATASSHYSGYSSAAGAVDGVTYATGFHTQEEDQPWLKIDLGTARTIRQVVVVNRSEYGERAVPLLIETSMDGHAYAQVASTDKTFGTWSASFAPTQARFVRLKATRRTLLHLNEVEVYGPRQ